MTESKETTSAKSERIHHLEQTVNNLKRTVIKGQKKAKRTRDNGSPVVGPVIPTGGINMEEHDLNGSWHTGVLSDLQGPNFLLANGGRPLSGNLIVNENITIDGVDISSLNVEFIYHRDTSADVHDQYAAGMGAPFDHKAKTAEWADWATSLNRSVKAGQGLEGGGLLDGNRTFAIDYDIIHTWNEIHTFNEGLNSGTVMPLLPDTNDIGSEVKRWRSAYISELKAVVLATETTTALGGYFMVTKDSGSLPTTMLPGDTVYDFGKFMTKDDIVLLRHMFVVEYIKIGDVIPEFAYTYNITRNLDGSGANTWEAGLPFVVLGQTGDGWIELSAYSSPRQSFMLQGSAYNLRDEVVRIGDLSNWEGASLTGKKGIAIGDWNLGDGPYMLYDPVDGLIVKGQMRADTGYLKDLSITGVLGLATTGRLQQGTGTWGTDFTGSALWNEGGVMNIGGWNTGTKEWWAGNDGKLHSGVAVFDRGGLTVMAHVQNGALIGSGMQWEDEQGVYAGGIDVYIPENFWDWYKRRTMRIHVAPAIADPYDSAIIIDATHITLTGQTLVTDDMQVSNRLTTDSLHVFENVGIGTTPVAGTALTVSGNASISGTLKDSAGNLYGRPVFLTTPLTSTSWDGDAKTSADRATIDLSAVFGVPAGVKAVLVYLQSSSPTAGAYSRVGPNSSFNYMLIAQTIVANVPVSYSGIVSCDANGDIYFYVSTGHTCTVYLYILGYWL